MLLSDQSRGRQPRVGTDLQFKYPDRCFCQNLCFRSFCRTFVKSPEWWMVRLIGRCTLCPELVLCKIHVTLCKIGILVTKPVSNIDPSCYRQWWEFILFHIPGSGSTFKKKYFAVGKLSGKSLSFCLICIPFLPPHLLLTLTSFHSHLKGLQIDLCNRVPGSQVWACFVLLFCFVLISTDDSNA